MAAIYGLEALIDHAQAQVDAADELLTRHDEVGLDLCRCGRPHPCPERLRWLQRRAHFVHLVGDPR